MSSRAHRVGDLVFVGWELPPSGLGRDARAALDCWLELLAAVACWPFGSVAAERRFRKRGRALVREQLILRAEGAGLVASADELARELGRLARPVLACRDGARPLAKNRLASALEPLGIIDATELRAASDIAPEGAGALEQAFAGLIDDLSEVGQATASFLAATPFPGAHPEPAEAVLPSAIGAPVALVSRADAVRRMVRFRLRLTSCREPLPASLMARAAAITLGPEASPTDSWQRAPTPEHLAAARRQAETLGVEPWGASADVGDDPLTSTTAAAVLTSLGRSYVLPRLRSFPAEEASIPARRPPRSPTPSRSCSARAEAPNSSDPSFTRRSPTRCSRSPTRRPTTSP